MTTIKTILDEVTASSGSNGKMATLKSHEDAPLIKEVIYQAKSKKIKFFLKQIPEYTPCVDMVPASLDWALVQLEEISNRTVTGGEATDHLKTILESVSEDDAYIIERIIDKDLKFGLGTTYINKVFKDLIEKTPYMGAKSFSEKLAKKIFEVGKDRQRKLAVSQVKMDGRYCNAIIRGGHVELESRQGETTHVGDAKFLRELSALPDCVLNGELTISDIKKYTIKDGETLNIDGVEYSPNEIIEKFKHNH